MMDEEDDIVRIDNELQWLVEKVKRHQFVIVWIAFIVTLNCFILISRTVW